MGTCHAPRLFAEIRTPKPCQPFLWGSDYANRSAPAMPIISAGRFSSLGPLGIIFSLRFWISQERQGVVSWFEFIDFRCDIVVGSLFGGHQFLGKAAPKITLGCFHQPGHQIFWHSVDRSILIDFGVD